MRPAGQGFGLHSGGGPADARIFHFDAVVQPAILQHREQVKGQFAVVKEVEKAADVGKGPGLAVGFLGHQHIVAD